MDYKKKYLKYKNKYFQLRGGGDLNNNEELTNDEELDKTKKDFDTSVTITLENDPTNTTITSTHFYVYNNTIYRINIFIFILLKNDFVIRIEIGNIYNDIKSVLDYNSETYFIRCIIYNDINTYNSEIIINKVKQIHKYHNIIKDNIILSINTLLDIFYEHLNESDHTKQELFRINNPRFIPSIEQPVYP
jgi:hypothetical protein